MQESSPASPARHAQLLARIARAAREANRRPGEITLVAAAKTFPPEQIIPLLRAGHRVFGENRVQEARKKWPDLRRRFAGLELHLIGPLQTNKTRAAIELFDVIQTLDRPRLAHALAEARAAHASGGGPPPRPFPRLFVQVNIGEEPQKSGLAPAALESFLALCRTLGLAVEGLMGLPPQGRNPAPYFALLDKLAHANRLPALSMGMSEDFETAIMLGASHVRIGRALFGPRPSGAAG